MSIMHHFRKLNLLLVVLVNIIALVQCVCFPQTACHPGRLDVSDLSQTTINVTSTCGSPSETFCSKTDCTLVCNAANPSQSHPKSLMLDDFNLATYWKSKNLDAPVTIQLDLQQKLILHQVVTTFQFDVPSGVYLDRSQDFGKTYGRLAYFATNCLSMFSVSQSPGYSTTNTVCLLISTTAITTKTISYMPRTDATIQTEVSKSGPVRDHFIFTNLKFVLYDYVKPAIFNKNTADPKKYFFSVKDFDVQGSCYCNGMSNKCNTTVYGNCVCQKNTAGTNCEKCNPLYNNKAWQYGIACQACNCSGLAQSCIYEASKGYGVCQSCNHNTGGDFCHECRSGFHRNASQSCVDCGCDTRGVNTSGRICNQTTGICQCKINVEGSKCNSCKQLFWGLSGSDPNGCKACNCRTAATMNSSSICDSNSGQCPCMPGFTGRTCNACQVGYYSSQIINPVACTACDCNPSGSHNRSCSTSGACFCRPFYSGNKCNIIANGYFFASVEQLLFSSLNAMVISSASYTMTTTRISVSQGSTLTITGYSLGLDTKTATSTSLIFTINLPSTSGYQFIIRYMTSASFSSVAMTITRQSAFGSYSCIREGIQENVTQNSPIKFQTDLLSTSQNASFGTACLSTGQYSVAIMIPYNSSSAAARIMISSLLVLPSYQYSSLYLIANSTTKTSIRTYYQRAFSFASWSVHRIEGSSHLAYIFGTIYTSAIACNCDSSGSLNSATCQVQGGQCSCKSLVTGRRCNACFLNAFNFTSGTGCSACGCHSFGSINESCHSIDGTCSCRPNVIGNKCNQCSVNHYGINTGKGCVQCNCSQVYATGQQCHDNGTCICKPGIGGKTCSACSPGFHNLTTSGCSRCSCNAIGSINSVCNANNASCPCKPNAAGASCNQCKNGYYGFNSQFPNACLKCQCSGHTTVCKKAVGLYQVVIASNLSMRRDNTPIDGWTAVNQDGLRSGQFIWTWVFFTGYARLENTRSDSQLYFSAPAKYLGNKRASYMLKLKFNMTQQNASQPMNSLDGDVILRGNEVPFSLVTTLPNPPSLYPQFTNYEVKFDERFWRKNRTDGPVATSEDMIAVLRNLKALLIRGKWTTVNGQFSGLTLIRMQQSTKALSSSVAHNVENCSCPIGYTGLSCETCAVGYTRKAPNGFSNVKCVPCNCNNHSSTCDPVNGTCTNCQHSTTGNNCQQCLTGYYGNATRGTTSDCSQCPCPGGPGASNQFATTCVLSSDGLPTCIACQPGYTGRRCDVCLDGYSGNPMVANGRCNRCICSDNIDLGSSGNCNKTTGECLKCINNSTGSNCEWCNDGFFGSAPSRTCQACSCNLIGSTSANCHNMTGICACKSMQTVGRTCDRCSPNAFNFTSGDGCQPCNCNNHGSVSLQCLNNGNCSCKPRVTGEKCDSCISGFYDLSKGCLPCNCSSNFTRENTTCPSVTGQCVCKSSRLGGLYGGRQCSQCGSNAIGTPPDCALCVQPCYDNWQRYIATETRNLANLTTNTNTLLAKFGGMSYAQINSQLLYLNGNLTYAGSIFEGAQYDTKAKETQFKQIETSIITFEKSINQSESRLKAVEQYFKATEVFNGSVNLDSSTPTSLPSPFSNIQISSFTFNLPATASPSSITTMANGLLKTSKDNNVTGYLVYSTTVQNYNQIRSANESITKAATDIANAMKSLATAAAERTKASSFISGSFQTTFQANAAELNSINNMVQSLRVLLNATAKTHTEATSLLSTAQATINSAESAVKSRRTAANAASQSASQMYISGVALNTDATATQSSAALFKSNADAVLYDAQQTATSVANSINRVSRIRNQTTQVISTANKVINQSLPVSLARIQSLSNQITATSIEETQINKTLIGAADGLKKAQDVQKLSQQAVNASQTTLSDIQGVEASLRQAESLRNTTKLMQSNNTKKAAEIKNITGTVEKQFKNLQGTGAQTLALVNTTIMQVNASMMCFANAKKVVDNATILAQSAQNSSAHSLVTHQSNKQRISSYSTQINTAFSTTNSQFSQVQQAKTNATQLLTDVTEAERLLAQFIAQNAELTSLQTEAANLETELDNLITKFDQTAKKLSTCKRN